MRTLTPKECEPGMIVADQVLTPIGQILAPAGTELTRQLINRMKLYRVESVKVMGEDEASAPVPAPAPVPAATPVVQQPAPPVQQPAAQPVVAQPAPPAHSEEPDTSNTLASQFITHTQKVAASDEFKDFQMEYFAALDKLKLVFAATTTRGQQIDTADLLNSVSILFTSRNTIIELFDMLYNMRVVKDSVYAHCLNVGLISRMIGRWLKMDSHDLNILTLAGLFHDIGKIRIPAEILDKPGKLTDEEFALIKKHPQFGYEILKSQPIDPRIKKAALMHHERCDGSGYPSGLTEDFIDEFAMIVGIADVYDAMTTARSYRAPLCPFQVIASFEKEGFQKYNTRYILTFLKQIAATYQSNRVLLSDGRSCNIVMLNQQSLARPMVQLDDGSIIDLSTQKELFIKSVL